MSSPRHCKPNYTVLLAVLPVGSYCCETWGTIYILLRTVHSITIYHKKGGLLNVWCQQSVSH